jgi:FKBP-type peptidyl-prolyl cis-trans isomerase SlyD
MSISENKVVSIIYTVKDTDTNEVIDSNVGEKPLSFITGKNHVIAGLEKGIMEMSPDEEKDILVKAEDAYGQRDENAIATLPIEQFAGIDLEEGMTLYGQGENGETVQVIVKNFNNSEVTIDFNHPLAGKDLLFNVKILSVRDATPDEILNSQVFEEDDVCGCDTGICY